MSKNSDKAYHYIREMVLAGSVPAGGALTEKDLAIEIGVSRTPVRDALQRLSAEGLIDFSPARRASAPVWTLKEVEESFHYRVILEGHAASLAAGQISAPKIAELRSLNHEMEALIHQNSTEKIQRIGQINKQFHQVILEAADSRRLATLLQGIVEMTVVLRTFSRYSDEELQRSCRHHQEIIDACEARDGNWARAIMEAHILAGRAAYMRKLDEQSADRPSSYVP